MSVTFDVDSIKETEVFVWSTHKDVVFIIFSTKNMKLPFLYRTFIVK